MTPDPDLYGPPERGNEDDEQDDDWELAFEWAPPPEDCPECDLPAGAHVSYCSLNPARGPR